MIGTTIGGTNQDAKRRLRESPCGTEATLMTFTWKERDARHKQRANAQNMDATQGQEGKASGVDAAVKPALLVAT